MDKQLLNNDESTIVGLCTPVGSGALALIRMSGVDVKNIADKFCYLISKKTISLVDSHTIHYGSIIGYDGQLIDKVMIIVMNGPKTFTGQDTVEITCHNNPFIIESIISLAIQNGARAAAQGEFTKRSFIDGKIDLIQAEAINSLIGANTQFALKNSLAQIDGSLSNWVLKIEKKLVHALAYSEASFEFLDEEASFGSKIKNDIIDIIKDVEITKLAYNQQQQIREGIRISIIGSVNAGKSSLFNALSNQKKAIVTDIAGTTRDYIETGLYINGNYWTLVDTAGIRQTADIIEQEGVKRSFEQAHKSDIILLLIDASRNMSKEELEVYREIYDKYKDKIILVYNKSDLHHTLHIAPFGPSISISSKNGQNLDVLLKEIDSKISKLFAASDVPFMLNKRHFNLLLGLQAKLTDLLAQLDGEIQYEIISYLIKDSLEYISEFTGRSISEAGMDAVFKEFCVGK